ncbi:hypothetical protein GO730_36065 [Spirosoma sp. HMF3257]|uniref:Uncharacterized protein n=1 Tax=Spirosoma telluris TaxID=2183553 RepID=A0A327NUA5_9BACT|nr:hypothetical protein [Spirosoma telluris]RAI78153.1 hypothetical protein HMF3257_35985 [Spirosoma telluris]
MPINRLIALFFLIGICSCQHQSTDPAPLVLKDAPCDCPFLSDQPTYTVNQSPDSLTRYYLAIWKRKFIQRNGLDDTRFDAMIKYVSPTLFNWQSGVSFRVDFIYQLDWLRIRHHEQFMVYYDPATTKAFYTDVPRGVYLTEAQIPARGLFDDYQPIQIGAKLAFASCEAACQALKTKTGFPVLKPNQVSFYPSMQLPALPTGEPYLFSAGTLDSTTNRCVEGRINLVTGEAKAIEGVCWVN